MNKKFISIGNFSKTLYCIFDFLIPIASVYQLVFIYNLITMKYYPKKFILPLLLFLLTISLLSFIQRKNECSKCLIIKDNSLLICKKTIKNLSITETITIEPDAKFTTKGIFGIYLEQSNIKRKILNYSPSILLCICSCLFINGYCPVFLLSKSII